MAYSFCFSPAFFNDGAGSKQSYKLHSRLFGQPLRTKIVQGDTGLDSREPNPLESESEEQNQRLGGQPPARSRRSDVTVDFSKVLLEVDIRETAVAHNRSSFLAP